MGQFKALATKNWVLYKRSVLGSVCEILLPIIFMLFVFMVRQLVEVENQDAKSQFSSKYDFDLNTSLPLILKNCSNMTVALAPSGKNIITELDSQLTGLGFATETFDSNSDIQAEVEDLDYGKSRKYFCFGIVFENEGPDYKYKLRFNITREAPNTEFDLTLQNPFYYTSYSQVVASGMAWATNFVNSIILQTQMSNSSKSFENRLVPIYQQAYEIDNIYTFLGDSLEFLVLLPLLIIYLRQTSEMLEEKQKKVRESMSIMGMKLWVYYLTWFIRYFAVYLVVHLIGSAILVGAFPHFTFFVPFIVFILFDILLIVQSFFIQIFFTRSKIGMVVALVFFIVQYVLSYTVSTTENPSVSIYQAISVVPHVAFILAFKEMLYAEAANTTVDFTSVVNYYTINTAIISLLCHIVLWIILTWYLDQVVPNEWGAKKHPCFCCVGPDKDAEDSEIQESPSKIHPMKTNDSDIESVEGKYKEMEANQKIIRIRNLEKSFGEVQAVQNLNLNMYTDQIFVLLGHNGAGKTTTISMLTGMLSPTSGHIEVLGESELQMIRSQIGVCPQHDTLYDELSVEEHIELFASFRGMEGEELEEEVDKLIQDVNLQEKREEYSKNLSGGQKRRLSVAMAFAGGSKVIILDEPTSGMDTSARRYIWEMLKNYRNDRIILLTTHFMDEADYLGDRIAIMSGGKLITCGSNVFLKNKFGVGYNITFVKKDIDKSSETIIKAVRKHVEDLKVLSDVSAELALQLPLDRVKVFGQLFSEIDNNKEQLGIQTYGISITTLQQVFLKVAEGVSKDQKDGQMEEIQLQPGASKKSINHMQEQQWEKEDQCCERFVSHFLATMLKRVRVIKRDVKSFLFELVLPIIIIILALLLMTVSFIRNLPAQELSYNTYAEEVNPVLVPIAASAASSLADAMKTEMETTYGSILNVSAANYSGPRTFDDSVLKELKLEDETLKGGIYFQPEDSGAYPFTSIVNTRSPTSPLAVQTLAAETYMNYLSPNATTITLINAPLPRTSYQLSINNTISGFFGALIFSIALSFKFASIVAFIVKERVDRSKHQQIVSGMNIGSYWIGNFFFDYLLYAVIAGVSVGICVGLEVEALIEGDAISATCLLFFLFGLANIPLTYILGYLFKDYGNGQAALYFFNFVAGGILPIVTLLLRWLHDESDGVPTGDVGRALSWVFRLIPAYSFGEGMINMGSLSILSLVENDGEDLDIFGLEITLAPIIFLCVGFFIYLFVLFLIQYIQTDENLMRCCSKEDQVEETFEINDDDVLAEQKRAIQSQPEEHQIITKRLRKVFLIDSEKKHKVAVDNLSFAVSKGEVFGLLGVNGAGKTTTFKILAGEIISTSGESYFGGLKISENLSTIRKNLGYCPQFDALIENLTVREQLELYYDMKCLPSKFKEDTISEKIREMGLVEYEDKLSGTLSGGNKRKLSVAMALIGNPSIVFLDEPSTGMDPKARRFMWKVISRISKERKQSTVILTTHSMEEAEALSTRLGIMVSGNFKCIGTPQHIKSKYGKGFEIEIKVKNAKKDEIEEVRKKYNLGNAIDVGRNSIESLQNSLKMKDSIREQIKKNGSGSYIWNDLNSGKLVSVNSVIEYNLIEERVLNISESLKKTFGQTEILEHFQTYVRFKTGDNIIVGKLFEYLQSQKDPLSIQQYSIKQATVEQIFNKFAEEDGMQMD